MHRQLDTTAARAGLTMAENTFLLHLLTFTYEKFSPIIHHPCREGAPDKGGEWEGWSVEPWNICPGV